MDTGCLILIVDDCSFNVFAIKGQIEQLGQEAQSCCNGNEAIKLVHDRIKSQKPMFKLILMDYSMPICDGPEATLQIRTHLAESGHTKA